MSNNLYSIISLGSILLTSVVGIYGVRGRIKNPVNRAFAIFCLGVSFYLFVELKFFISHTLKEILLWARIYYVSIFFVISNFLYFTLIFPKNRLLENKNIFFLIYLPVLLFIPCIFDNSLISDIYSFGRERTLKFGEVFPLFLIFFLSFFTYGIITLIKSYKESTAEILKIQISYILTGVIAGGVVGIFVNFVYPFFKIKPSPLSGVSFVVIVVFIAYALVREKPLDIGVLLKKTLLYYILTIGVIGFYILGVIKLGHFLASLVGFTSYLFQSILIVTVGFIFKPVADSLSNFIDAKLFPAIFNYRKVLSEFSNSLIYYVEVSTLTKLIIETVCKTLNIDRAVIFLNKENIFVPAENRGIFVENLKISEYENFFNFFLYNNRVWEFPRLKNIFRYDRKTSELLDNLNGKGIYLYIPIVSRNKLLGIFGISEKKTGIGFSEEELDLLFTISNQAAIALENAFAYENLKELYKKLSEAEKFSAIGELSAEIAHQIRNPLNNIKGAAELLKSKKTDPEEKEKFLNYLIEEVGRLNQLLQEFFHYSRPAKLQLQKTDINKFLQKILDNFEIEFSNSKIELATHFDTSLPEISLDREEMEKAFTNIIKNAIQSMEGGGKLSVYTEFKTPAVEIRFSDTGSGIDEKDISKIFSPFFTTKKDGTGLGLSIVQKIIKLHNGEISVESKKNQGTTFLVRLPLT